jgi:hypothetical protein
MMTLPQLPYGLVGEEICTKLDASSRISLIDVFPFLKPSVSWVNLDISSKNLDDLLHTLGLLEKHTTGCSVEKIEVECRWAMSAPHIAPLVMSSLCRMLINHSHTITEVSINFTHVEKITDPNETFRHCLITASGLFVQCMNMPRVHTLHLGGLGVSATWRTLGAASPPGYYACVSIDGVYAIPARGKRWTCMYMDDEEGLAFLEISEPHTVCEHLVQRFSWHKDHVATYIDDEGAWTGGMRFVPGDPVFFAFPMFVAASLADAV